MAPPTLSGNVESYLLATLGAAPYAVGYNYASRPLACSSDGSLIAGITGRTAWIARASDGVVLRRVNGRSRKITAALLSPDGATLYTVGDRCTIAWNVSDGTPRFVFDQPATRAVATLTPDGSRLLIDAMSEVIALDASTGAICATAPRPKTGLGATPVVTADGALLALLGRGLLRVDRDLRVTAEIEADREFLRGCAVGDSKRIAAASGRSLLLIDLGDASVITQVELPGDVHALLARGDTLWVVHAKALGAYEWTLAPLDASTLQPRPRVARTMLPQLVSVCASGDTLWLSLNGTLLRRSLDAGGDLRQAFSARGVCASLRFDAKSEHLSATMGMYSTHSCAMRLSLSSGERVTRDFTNAVPLVLTRDASAVIVRGYTKDTRRYALDGSPEGEPVDPAGGHGTFYASGYDGRLVAIDEGATQALRVLPDGPTWPLPVKHRLGFMTEWHVDEELVSAHDLKRITVFDLRAGAYLDAVKVPTYRKLCWVSGGAWTANDKRAQLWDLRTGKRLREVKLDVPAWSIVTSIAASRDGRLLALGTSLGAVMLIELDGAERTAVFDAGGDGSLSACVFSDDGSLLATGDSLPTLRVWSVARILDAAPPAAKPAKKKRGAKG